MPCVLCISGTFLWNPNSICTMCSNFPGNDPELGNLIPFCLRPDISPGKPSAHSHVVKFTSTGVDSKICSITCFSPPKTVRPQVALTETWSQSITTVSFIAVCLRPGCWVQDVGRDAAIEMITSYGATALTFFSNVLGFPFEPVGTTTCDGLKLQTRC